jgi:DNA-binding FadR family transcriptional regulator
MFKKTRKRQKLSDTILEEIKREIVTEHKKPGDRLPNEKELMELYDVSKGTIRESLARLEMQGLISVRTGPNGGAYLQQIPYELTSESLRNFLHFQDLGSDHVYQIRKKFETELAVSVVGLLDDNDFELLQKSIEICSHQPQDEFELKIQREEELNFHNILAYKCPNPILGFLCRFLNDMLRDIMIYKNALLDEDFGKKNTNYHVELLAAFKAENKEKVQALMLEHMEDAEKHMHEMEANLKTQRLLFNGSV